MKHKNSSEIKIIPIDLKIDLPSDHLCMIMAQPFLKLQTTSNGFKLDRSILEMHKRTILSTLKLACNPPFGNSSYNTNFVVFPELALPYEMILEIRDRVSNSWPRNSILIAGIEAIDKEKYSILLKNSNNPQNSRGNLLGASNYINSGIVFLKEKDNGVKIYLQPKIKASEDEQAIGMIEGEHIFLFKTTNYNFLCLICFDFIGRDRTSPIPLVQDIIGKLSSDAPSGYCLNLDLVLILQYNNSPNHRCFQESARILLHEGRGKIEIRSLVFVNTASECFGSYVQYGESAFYFPRGTWAIPDKRKYPVNHTFVLERTDYGCERARFREDGPCVHSIVYIPRKSLGGDSRDIRYPLVPPPLCHKIMPDGSLEKGKAIPALQKVVSDSLPLNLAANDNRWNASNDASLRNEMKQKYHETRKKLINVSIEKMKELTDLLLLCHYSEDNRIENPDYWETRKEGEAIKELASTLSILTLLGEMVLDLPHKLLTGLLRQRFYVAVIDGKGAETPTVLQEKYGEYVKTNKYINIDPEKNILMVLCRHRGEQPRNGIAQEIVDFTLISRSEDSTMPQELQDANKFTVITGGRLFWHSRESLHGILEQNSLDEARTKLEEKLEPLRN